MKLKVIEVGQTVYVTTRGMFTKTKPNLEEYEVIKVNGSSFYAHKKGHPSKYPSRFDRKTMIHDSGMGYIDKAYLSADEYWNLIEIAKQKKELKDEIRNRLDDLDLKSLQEITTLIRTK